MVCLIGGMGEGLTVEFIKHCTSLSCLYRGLGTGDEITWFVPHGPLTCLRKLGTGNELLNSFPVDYRSVREDWALRMHFLILSPMEIDTRWRNFGANCVLYPIRNSLQKSRGVLDQIKQSCAQYCFRGTKTMGLFIEKRAVVPNIIAGGQKPMELFIEQELLCPIGQNLGRI